MHRTIRLTFVLTSNKRGLKKLSQTPKWGPCRVYIFRVIGKTLFCASRTLGGRAPCLPAQIQEGTCK